MKDQTKKANMKNNLFNMALWVALVAAFLFWSWHRIAPDQWFAFFAFFVALMAVSFFETRWVSKQPDQLRACYRAANISMWIFLLLAVVSTVPNFFIAGRIDKTVLWPVALISTIRFVLSAVRRNELVRELAEREKSNSMNDLAVRNLST